MSSQSTDSKWEMKESHSLSDAHKLSLHVSSFTRRYKALDFEATAF